MSNDEKGQSQAFPYSDLIFLSKSLTCKLHLMNDHRHAPNSSRPSSFLWLSLGEPWLWTLWSRGYEDIGKVAEKRLTDFVLGFVDTHCSGMNLKDPR